MSFFVDGKTIRYGSRRVLNTNGTLVCLSPTSFVVTISVSFPDFQKDMMYRWDQKQVGNDVDGYALAEGAQHWTTVIKQDTTRTYTIATLKAGVDFTAQFVRLRRTRAPSKWAGRTLIPLITENVDVVWFGSGQIERALGMTRLIHIGIVGSNLVAVLQQSVSNPPGGFGNFPIANGAGPGNATEVKFKSKAGIPVFMNRIKRNPTSGSVRRTSEQIFGLTTLRYGSSGQLSLKDTSNYTSTYELSVTGQMGIIS